METRAVNSFFFVCLLLIPGFSESVGKENSCPEPGTTCGNLPVRFPFRVIGRQPEQCGYPGFDLQCSSANQAVLELPGSVKLNVKRIHYKSQTIQLYDPSGCLISRHVRNLTLVPSSPFQIKHQNLNDFTISNCSSPRDGEIISTCLGRSAYQVYAALSYRVMGHLPLLFCSKIFNISSVPSEIFYVDNTLVLIWSNPMCKHCESNGTRCGFKNSNTSSGTACFEVLRHKGSSDKYVITGSIMGSLLVVSALVAIVYIHNSHKARKESQAIIEKFLKDYRALKPTRYSYAEIKRITNQFEVKLWEGSFGTVFKGNISSEFIVAVKILNNSEGDGEEFITEVGTMGKIHHVIIRLIGFCADGFRRALVYEYFPNGSLQSFMHSPDNRQNFVGWKKLHEIALGIAKVIEYLHQGCEQRILHFDIKPHNVLLDDDLTPKICDFGLAKLCSKDQSIVSMTNTRGTLGNIAPEVFSRNFGSVS